MDENRKKKLRAMLDSDDSGDDSPNPFKKEALGGGASAFGGKKTPQSSVYDGKSAAGKSIASAAKPVNVQTQGGKTAVPVVTDFKEDVGGVDEF